MKKKIEVKGKIKSKNSLEMIGSRKVNLGPTIVNRVLGGSFDNNPVSKFIVNHVANNYGNKIGAEVAEVSYYTKTSYNIYTKAAGKSWDKAEIFFYREKKD